MSLRKYLGLFCFLVATLLFILIELPDPFSFSNPNAFDNLIGFIVLSLTGAILFFGFDSIITFVGVSNLKKGAIVLVCGVIAYYIAFVYTEGSRRVNVVPPTPLPIPSPAPLPIPSPSPIRKEICSICHGTGYRTCIVCSGTGKTLNRVPDPPRFFGTGSYVAKPIYKTCTICHGRGEKVCIGCSGAGYTIY